MTGYAVIIEGGEGSYSGYVPDLPGCVAAGDSIDVVEARIREAIALHIESLKAHGEPVPMAATAAVRMVGTATPIPEALPAQPDLSLIGDMQRSERQRAPRP